jgi:hypothetical protein
VANKQKLADGVDIMKFSKKTKRILMISLCFTLVLGICVPIFAALYFYNNQHFSWLLVDAIRENDIQKVERIIDKFPHGNINSPTIRTQIWANFQQMSSTTPLLEACAYWARGGDNFDMIKLLVENGADVNYTGLHGNIPLQSVVRLSTRSETGFEIVRFLVENGADVNHGSNILIQLLPLWWQTEWSLESKPYFFEIFEYLVEHGAVVDDEVIAAAERTENTEVIEFVMRFYDGS